jgi:3-methylfumaryl-CoA hydratase
MAIDLENLRSSIGHEERGSVLLDLASVHRMAAMLDRPVAPNAGDVLPCLWHWMFTTLPVRACDLGKDGHAATGSFLPGIPLPRRLWAGSRLQFKVPIRIGDTIARRSSIIDVRLKEGRSGPLVFVTLRHEISVAGTLAIEEEQDLVYRDRPSAGAPVAAQTGIDATSQFSRVVVPDSVLLFRYSALTFNAHRIHYDRRYAAEEEGYPGLVVHAPLTATLLLELLSRERSDAQVESLRFQAIQPLFDLRPLSLHGHLADRDATLWADAPEGGVAISMQLRLRDAA